MKIQSCYHAIMSPSLRKIIKEMEALPLPQCGSEVVRSKASSKVWMTLLSSDPLTKQGMPVLGLRTIRAAEELSFKDNSWTPLAIAFDTE